jgi:hypothetical protein
MARDYQLTKDIIEHTFNTLGLIGRPAQTSA